MKVQVYVKLDQPKATCGSLKPLAFRVGPGDTAAGLRGRVEAVEPLAGAVAAKSLVVFEGQTLQEGQRLVDCGVKEGSSLDLVVQISAQAFAQQLAELLQAQAGTVALEELGLIYLHRHGVAVGRVLEALGYDTKLSRFLEDYGKLFAVQDTRVKLICAEPAASKVLEPIPEGSSPPLFRAKELEVRVSIRPEGLEALPPSAIAATEPVLLQVDAGETVHNVKTRVSQAGLLPFPDQELLLGDRALGDGEHLLDSLKQESDLPALELVVRPSEKCLTKQLMELLLLRASRASSPDELSLLYCYRYGATVTRALKLLNSRESFGDFLKRQSHFLVEKGCVTLAPGGLVKAARLLDTVIEAASFLNIRRVERQLQPQSEKSRGQALAGMVHATIFLGGLPPASQDQGKWLPGLLKSIAAGLQERLSQACGIQSICVVEDFVQVIAEDVATVKLHVSPSSG
jgi:hypothetical protein